MTITSKERRLYQQIIVERSRKPRHFGETNPVDLSHRLTNPYCGDSVEISIALNEAKNQIKDFKFKGSGCALCLASADLAIETIKGKTIVQARQIIEHFEGVMLGRIELDPNYKSLRAIEGAKRYPIKIKCVTLAWHVLKTAIANLDHS